MPEPTTPPVPAVSRRALLRGATAGGAVLAAGVLAPPAQAQEGPDRREAGDRRTPDLWRRPAAAGAPPVEGLHLTFGADPSREMLASWATVDQVARPRVRWGTPDDGFGREVPAESRTYRDAQSGQQVTVHTARLTGLRPDARYVYAAVHDGADPDAGFFRTAPRGRAPFVFTSFGDMASPGTVVRDKATGRYVNDALGSPYSADLVDGIERVGPLFNLLNGDLCYANLSADRVRVWQSWFANVSRSARYRPWMPTAGNHENEKGNGPIGFAAYQTYFPLPAPSGDPLTQGLWYAFTVGTVRFVFVNNDDVCYQDGGNTYVRGYSGGAQRQWLERELAAARADRSVDWIVVCMHQVVVSTADRFNGADRGIREEFVPLFDRYGVDLVVCGHEHHYERSHPVRGAQPSDTLTPVPRGDRRDVVDTGAGTVHMVLGGGGTSVPSNMLLTDPPRCRVITGVGPADPATGKRPPVYVWEDAPWSAVRDKGHAYGFAAFTVDPGRGPGGTTSIGVTYYDVTGPGGSLAVHDAFTLQKARRDRP